MGGGVKEDLQHYFFLERPQLTNEKMHAESQRAFMLHCRGGRMMGPTYNRILKTLMRRAGMDENKVLKTSAHVMRHSIATHLLEKGASLEHVRDFLGHSQLETTQIYTHINTKQLNKLVNL